MKSHESDFVILEQPQFIELPIQLRDGSWIKLSSITAIICNQNPMDAGKGRIEVSTSHGSIWMPDMELDVAKEYSSLLGGWWRKSIIDRETHYANQGATKRP